jgi:hypothetical protein
MKKTISCVAATSLLFFTMTESLKAPFKTVNQPQPSSSQKKRNEGKYVSSAREYGGDKEGLMYKSGIPTLRSSAHRVKFDKKNRKHDPKPKDRNGKETKTTWLPHEMLQEHVFAYDETEYNLKGAVLKLLQDCDHDIVGDFGSSKGETKLEDFRVPIPSVWRKVNGGKCEASQKYLSDQVASNDQFLDTFDKFVVEAALPYVKERLLASENISENKDENDELNITFYYQR